MLEISYRDCPSGAFRKVIVLLIFRQGTVHSEDHYIYFIVSLKGTRAHLHEWQCTNFYYAQISLRCKSSLHSQLALNSTLLCLIVAQKTFAFPNVWHTEKTVPKGLVTVFACVLQAYLSLAFCVLLVHGPDSIHAI